MTRNTRDLSGWSWREARITEFIERQGKHSPRTKIDIRVDDCDDWISWGGALWPELGELALIYQHNKHSALRFAISSRGG